jgi:hypothetical protein
MNRQAHERPEEAPQGAQMDVVDATGVVDAVAVVELDERQAPQPPRVRRTAAEILFGRLSMIEVGGGTTHERMVVFPIFAPGAGAGGAPLRYRTLEQAIADSSVEVTEQASATVPELVLHNKGAVMIFVLDGEEIIGGRQNRIVNASFLVGANATVALPVTCVEHGRWHSTSRTFASGESTYHSLRSEKFAQVSASLRDTGRHSSDQGAVWDSVARKAMVAGAASPTGAMNEIYQSRGDSLTGYLGAFPYVAGAIGFAVALGGQMAGADLFDQPATAEALWPKLLRSYALDALDTPEGATVERRQATRLFEQTRGAHAETYPSLALGEDVRFDGEGVVGGGLVYEETPLHVTLFRAQGASATQPSTMTRASQRRQAYLQRSQQADQSV